MQPGKTDMAKVFLICGKLCSGKSTYAKTLCLQKKAVLLSVDEIMLALFGQDAGDRHDEFAQKTQRLLLQKSVQLVESGVSVVLDWGFWQKEKRSLTKAFYTERRIPCEFHYLDVDEKTRKARLEKRNRAVQANALRAYYVDEGLAAKCERLFEPPCPEEIDVWVKQ